MKVEFKRVLLRTTFIYFAEFIFLLQLKVGVMIFPQYTWGKTIYLLNLGEEIWKFVGV
jgi:hypothetical protein